MAKIICVIPNNIPRNYYLLIFTVFVNYSHLNVAIVLQNSFGDVIFETFPSLLLTVKQIRNPSDSQVIFPDKLRNMVGTPYLIPVYPQPPRVFITGIRVNSKLRFFLEAIREHQNSNYKFVLLQNSAYLHDYWVSGKMHLTLNTATIFNAAEPKLLTYEETGYCALIPHPKRQSYLRLVFIEPFDVQTWMLILTSMTSAVIIWWMFRDFGAVGSHWKLAFGIYTMFIGQGAEFSRQKRFVLACLLQLIVFAIFVLSNAYESVITSSMIEPARIKRIDTIDELLASNFELMVAEGFAFSIKDVQEYKVLKMNVSATRLELKEYIQEIIRQHFVFILRCDDAEIELSFRMANGRYFSDLYYILPERISTRFIMLEASFSNPFLHRLQYFMDLSFEAGLPHMWNVLMNQVFSKRKFIDVDEDQVFLALKDIAPIFFILITGCIFSTFVFLFEIFYQSCWRHVSVKDFSENVRKRVNKMAHKEKKVIRRHRKSNKIKRLQCKKTNVRKIFVKPRGTESKTSDNDL